MPLVSLPVVVEAVCRPYTGTRPVIGKVPAPYGCCDRWSLLGEPYQGRVWVAAEEMSLSVAESGFYVEDLRPVAVQAVWY